MPLMIAGSSSCLYCLKVLSAAEEEKKEVSLRKSSLPSAAEGRRPLLLEEVARKALHQKETFSLPTTLEARNKATVANTFVF